MGAFMAIIYLTIIVGLIKVYFKLFYGYLSRCHSPVCLVGKTAVVTGANSGIGYQVALDFAKRGARVILGCRSEDRAKAACQEIIRQTNNENVAYKLVDFSLLDSVRNFADEINKNEERLDILVNNAGAGGTGNRQTKDGLQLLMQVNYFSHFLLTNLLLDLLKKTHSSRIINVSSVMAKYAKNFDTHNLNQHPGETTLYCHTKLCNILFTIELASRLKDTSVTTYSLHPGAVETDIFRRLPSWMLSILKVIMKIGFKTSEEGAQVPIYLAVEKNIEEYSGKHFHYCKRKPIYYKTFTEDPQLPKKLWQSTNEVLKTKF